MKFCTFRLPMTLLLNRFLLFFGLLLPTAAAAQYRFIENKGQWVDSVNFKVDIPGGACYIEASGFLFDLHDQEMVNAVFAAHTGNSNPLSLPQVLQQHAYRVIFAGGNTGEPVAEKSFDTAYSYYIGNDPAKWASGAKGYERIRYPSIQPGIDALVYGKNNLKYDFIVSAGADPLAIALRYEGVQPKLDRSGNVVLKTAVGQVIETKPFAYQIIGGKLEQVACEYVVKGQEVRFKLGNYRTDLELVIDPELVFSTYTGSTADNFGYTATFDSEGHLYSGSTVFETGYPITIGAYQSVWGGGVGAGTLAGTDIGISKFSLDGTTLIYSTYLGGAGDELPHSLITDANGELYVFGTTGSANFPTTTGAFQNSFMGGEATLLGGIGVSYPNGADIIISRLSPSGNALLASTYVGGSNNDGTNTSAQLLFNYADEVRGEIELTIDGDIAIGSCTFSPNFPIPGNAAQPTKGTGEDGIFFTMNPSLTALLSGTFFGGNGNDAIYSIDLADDGSATVAGGTNSTNLPTTPGAFQPNFAGGTTDGFIANISAQATAIATATYYGSNLYDQIYFVERDAFDAPYIYGQTRAPGSSFISNAGYGVPNSGMLLSKFSPDLETRTWSTVFGTGSGNPSLSPTAFSVDICNRIYLSGWGGAVNQPNGGFTTGLPVTDDALQSTTDGSDFYFLVIDGDASALTFASFYGGGTSAEHVDGGTSRFDRSGKIYQAVCAGCGSNDDFPIFPPNALSPTNNSFNCNLGVAKIDFDLPLVLANFTASESCAPDSTYFTNASEIFSGSNASYTWFFPNGDTSAEINPAYVFPGPGTYEVTLAVDDPESCNLQDSFTQTVTVLPELILSVADTVFSCSPGDLEIVALTQETATFFLWASDPSFTQIISQGATDSILTINPAQAQTIYLRVSNGFCEIAEPVFLAPLPQLTLSTVSQTLCALDSIDISFTLSAGGQAESTVWSPESIVADGQGTATVTIFTAQSALIEVDVVTTFGCELSASAVLNVFPILLNTPADQLICENETILLTANSFGTAEIFQWSSTPDFTDILNAPGDSSITVKPSELTYYFIRVTNGPCVLTDSVGVSLLSTSTTVSADSFICAGDSLQLFVFNNLPEVPLTHIWQPESLILSGQNTSSVLVSVSETSTFDVLSTSAEGCTTENSITVFTSQLGFAAVDAIANPTAINQGQSSELTALPLNPDYSYQWTPPSGLSNAASANTTATPDSTTTYFIQITDFDTRGFCQKSDSVTIFVFEEICGEPSIFLPNAFSPNGDGENDILLLRGGNISSMHLAIHDRWGDLVFETRNQNTGWDGTYKGKLAAPAVFVFYLDVVCGDGQEFSKKGNVTLLR